MDGTKLIIIANVLWSNSYSLFCVIETNQSDTTLILCIIQTYIYVLCSLENVVFMISIFNFSLEIG